MPFRLLLIVSFFLLGGCNKLPSDSEADKPVAQPEAASSGTTGQRSVMPGKRVLAAFSGSETDQWTAALLGSLGSELHFDPWSVSDADDFFDYYGPYDLMHGNQPIELKIVLSGMDSIAGLERQQAAAAHLLGIASGFEADLVWLDGDQLQYSAGRLLLEDDFQIAFSGLQYDSSLYYEAQDNAAGFYRRHSVSGTMGQIWRDNPDALFHCIITDDSQEGRRRLIDFADAEDLLGEGSTLHVLPVFSTWQELAEEIAKLPPEADDLIICAAGESGAADSITGTPPPADLLTFCELPVYVLGPGNLDMLGCTSLNVNPAAQVHEMLTVFEANLSREIPMSAVPTIVPEDMQVRISEAPGL